MTHIHIDIQTHTHIHIHTCTHMRSQTRIHAHIHLIMHSVFNKTKKGNAKEREVKTGFGSGFKPMAMDDQAHT